MLKEPSGPIIFTMFLNMFGKVNSELCPGTVLSSAT